jgi:hypothetical protein
MFLLQRFPDGELKPEGFIEGSRAMLEDVTTKMVEAYQSDAGKAVAKEWIKFRDQVAPQSDSVTEHIKQHPEHWHIPLRDVLFSDAACVTGKDIPARVRKLRSSAKKAPPGRDRESKQLDSVCWTRRGVQKSRGDPALHFPNEVVRGPPGVNFSVPVYCRAKPSSDQTATPPKKKRGRLSPPPDEDTGKVNVLHSFCVLSSHLLNVCHCDCCCMCR